MGNSAVANAIHAKFTAEVATPQSMSVLHDNEPPASTVSKVWYRLTVMFDPREQLSAGREGQRRYRVPGRALLNMFTEQGDGDGDILELTDAVTLAFQNSPIASPQVAFEPPPHPDGGVETFDGWAKRDMLIYFEATLFE